MVPTRTKTSVKLVVSDVDGVMTDGSLYYTRLGEETKRFNVKDGLVIPLLRKAGLKLCIVSGRKSEIVRKRFDELQFDFIIQGVEDKLAEIKKVAGKLDITLDNVAYIGDDLNDLEVLQNVGFSACPNDAIETLKEQVDYVCSKKGGEGAFREFADFILTRNNDAG